MYYIVFAIQIEMAIMSIKQALLKSNESSLKKKVVLLKLTYLQIIPMNDTHEVHKVSLARFSMEKHFSVAPIWML